MERRRWSHTIPAKMLGFFIFIAGTAVLLISGFGILHMADEGFYSQPFDTVLLNCMYGQASQDVADLMTQFQSFLEEGNDPEEFEAYVSSESYLSSSNSEQPLLTQQDGTESWYYEIRDKNGTQLAGNYEGQLCYAYSFDGSWWSSELENYEVILYIDKTFSVESRYSEILHICSELYRIRYGLAATAAAALLLIICSYVFLMCGAGHRFGEKELVQGPFVRLPLELYLCLAAVLVSAEIWFLDRVDFRYYIGDWDFFITYPVSYLAAQAALAVCMAIAASATLGGISMNFAVRIKLKLFFKNTIIYRILRKFWRIGKSVLTGTVNLIRGLPSVTRTAVAAFAVIFLEMVFLVLFFYSPGKMLFLFLLEKSVIFLIVIYFAMSLRILEKGGQALAEGDLNYQIDTGKLSGELKRHGENLNSISEGMNAAVNERMKSERMKTELITNVSHDIKTPLTSIINYTDLIAKEHSENEKINEYAAVLSRQSARLKKLIEDLVEASKASTGNVEVHLTPMEVGVILIQAEGEYGERLQERHLQLISRQPKEPVRIMADGRHLWRVIDNLMSNICKYAQPYTRVYLTVERRGEKAYICFKNTSSYPLDIPAEELLERFVRGDASRSTEGNGLGLSIAQSLTALQRGTLELAVDGDLFKATLIFDALPPERNEFAEETEISLRMPDPS